MNFQVLRCPECGQEKIEKNGEKYYCVYCACSFTDDTAERAFRELENNLKVFVDGALDGAFKKEKEELFYNLRTSLWEKARAKYIDSEAIVNTCREIKKLAPADFLANFYETANSASHAEVAEFLNRIDVKKEELYIDRVIEFMLKSLTADYIAPLNYLIERAYKNTDLKKYLDAISALEAESAKIDSGVYETIIPRDVFIAYSSKDMGEVLELTKLLEENGITCFVALRNLRHGRDAVANYEVALRTAIDNCSMLIFVSSVNSRSFACDALKQELSYIKSREMNDAPPEYKSGYARLPMKYKKSRIEYRLDNEKTPAADLFLKEFFSGLDYCESQDKVMARVVEIMTDRMNDPDPEHAVPHAPVVVSFEQPTAPVAVTMAPPSADSASSVAPITVLTPKAPPKRPDSSFFESDEYRSCFVLNKTVLQKFKPASIEDEYAGIAITPDNITAVGLLAFEKCDSLREVFVTDGVTKIDACAFNKCYGLETVRLPESITEIKHSAFDQCVSLREVNIPDAITRLGDWAFRDCKKLKKINIPKNIDMIPSSAFQNCESVEEIIIPDGVTEIRMWAFMGCKALKRVVIPASVLKMGDGVFKDCPKVTIYAKAKEKPKKWGEGFFSNWNPDGRPVVWGYEDA